MPVERSLAGLVERSLAGLVERAFAKVNLYLHVVGRREDGYHLLDSLAVFAGACDVLRGAAPAPGGAALSLTLGGRFGAGLAGEPDNLVLRAARALATSAGVAALADLTLEKNLPVASGIGGGSADAAAALRLLARLWDVPPATPALALSLGADVPVCLESRPRRMGGIGEALGDVPPPPAFGIVLVNPGVGVSTPAVFRARGGGFSPPAAYPERWRDTADFFAWLRGLGNDLEPPAVALCPVIADVIAALRAAPGCRLARMSGSGATCFGLFDAADAARAATAGIGAPGWWVWAGGMA